jgi:Arc/MetJ-type ribon-helix-helix transcriptional regulator
MSYPFPPELNQLIQEGIASGGYSSEDGILLEAMRLLRSRGQREQELRAEVQTRIERLDRGEGTVLEGENDLRRFFDDIQIRGMQRYHNSIQVIHSARDIDAVVRRKPPYP